MSRPQSLDGLDSSGGQSEAAIGRATPESTVGNNILLPNDVDQQPLAPDSEGFQRFVPGEIAIPVEPLLRIHGYRDMPAVRADVRDIAESMAACARELLAVEAYYRRLRIASSSDGRIELETGTAFRSAALGETLEGCQEIFVFVLTLGPRLDEKTQALLQDINVVEALFLETAGWLAVERATKALAQHLWDQVADRGLGLSRRLAPGYADWPLEDQGPLFALFDAVPLPVRLLESYAMMPKNSRSGVYGLRPTA